MFSSSGTGRPTPRVRFARAGGGPVVGDSMIAVSSSSPPSSVRDEIRASNTNKTGAYNYVIDTQCFCVILTLLMTAVVVSLAALVVAIITTVGVYDNYESWAGDDGGGHGNAIYGRSLGVSAYDSSPDSWTQWGRDVRCSRHVADPNAPSLSTVNKLRLRWRHTARGEIRTQPSVHDGVAYYCDTAGYLSAVRLDTGALAWERRVATLTGSGLEGAADYCRGPPTLVPDAGVIVAGSRNSSVIFGVRMRDGSPLWHTRVDDHPRSVITQPATVVDGVAYVGVSSTEETDAADSAYTCCSFRGSVVAVSVSNGELIWKTPTLPVGYVGAAVWGPAPVVDAARRQVYVGTGNLYADPAGLADCEARIAALGTFFEDDPCLPTSVYSMSVLALDVTTGRPNWVRRISPAEAWNAACGVTTPVGSSPALAYNCPAYRGLNADFAQGPMLVRVHGEKDVLVIGQKSGVVWTLNPNNGHVMNSVTVGPEGEGGGVLWSGATDGERAFLPVTNSASTPFTLVNPVQGAVSNTTVGSALSAVRVRSSQILWQYPMEAWLYASLPVTSVNDIVFSAAVLRTANVNANTNRASSIKAHSAATGAKLWEAPSAYVATSGVTVASGVVLFGATYHTPSAPDSPQLVAFAR